MPKPSLTIYTLSGDTEVVFHSSSPVIITEFTYVAGRMSETTLSCKVKCPDCLDEEWTGNEFVTFRGVRLFVDGTPSSSKDNTDSRYSHDITFKAQRDIALRAIYFYDCVSSSSTTYDKYQSGNTKVCFFGTLSEFVQRVNDSLSYRGLGGTYSVVVDNDVTTEAKMVSFEDKTVFEVLQAAYDLWEVPFYFEGNVAHFGRDTDNVISGIFQYGASQRLTGISKTNSGNEVITSCTGVGSSDNIPYYYPNPTAKGTIGAKLNGSASGVSVTDMKKFSKGLDLNDTLTYDGSAWKNGAGKTVSLSDIGLSLSVTPSSGNTITQYVISKITPQQNLMPPLYRSSGGEQRFYNALNNTYPKAGGGYYYFENPYNDRAPKEYIASFEDIKPSIKEMTYGGQRIDLLSAVWFDSGYNTNETYVNSKGETVYKYTYFFAKIRPLGFNLFDCAIDEDEMTVSMTSGDCGACSFKIIVTEDTKQNDVQVDASGNLVLENGFAKRNPNNIIASQNDTTSNSVWLCLALDESTYGGRDVDLGVMPNYNKNTGAGQKPSALDSFVLLHIDMPSAYVSAAEDRLKTAILDKMEDNNVEKYNFSTPLSRVFLEQNPTIASSITEHSAMYVSYNGVTLPDPLYITSYTYKCNDSDSLPEISVELEEKITVYKSSIQRQLDDMAGKIDDSKDGKNGKNGSDGLNNATVSLYKRGATSPSPLPGTCTYTFATGQLSGMLNDWSQTPPPSTSDHYPLWQTQGIASSNTETAEISSWTEAIKILEDGAEGQPGQQGDDGLDGYNSAELTLYKRSLNGAPSKPATSTTYTFSTHSYSPLPSGWSQTIPTSNPEQPCYVTKANVVSRDDSVTVPPSAWSDPQRLTGDNGLQGKIMRGVNEFSSNGLPDGRGTGVNGYQGLDEVNTAFAFYDVVYRTIVVDEQTVRTYYYCKNGDGATAYTPGVTQDWQNYWVVATNFDFVATRVLLASNAHIDCLSGNSVYMKDGETVYAGMQGGTGVNFFAGTSSSQQQPASAPFRVSHNGDMYASRATLANGCSIGDNIEISSNSIRTKNSSASGGVSIDQDTITVWSTQAQGGRYTQVYGGAQGGPNMWARQKSGEPALEISTVGSETPIQIDSESSGGVKVGSKYVTLSSTLGLKIEVVSSYPATLADNTIYIKIA